jgi:hypothetical protein
VASGAASRASIAASTVAPRGTIRTRPSAVVPTTCARTTPSTRFPRATRAGRRSAAAAAADSRT